MEPHYYGDDRKNTTPCEVAFFLVHLNFVDNVFDVGVEVGRPNIKTKIVVALGGLSKYLLYAGTCFFESAEVVERMVFALVRTALAEVIAMCYSINKHRKISSQAVGRYPFSNYIIPPLTEKVKRQNSSGV